MPAPLALLVALALSSGTQAPGADAPGTNVAAPTDTFRPDPAWKNLGPSIWFDPAARTLIVRARVSLTDGPLEHLLCRKGTKEHEAILSTEAPPRTIHAGLLLTGATAEHPVRFDPKFEPPAGTPLAITLQWEENGKTRRADAREWVKDHMSGKPLERDWVFAGSEMFTDPQSKKVLYAADDGDLITVANFPSSIVDLPFRSSASDADRGFEAFAGRIPPRGTPVTMIFQPRDAAKPAAKPTTGPQN